MNAAPQVTTTNQTREDLARAFYDDWRAKHPGTLRWENDAPFRKDPMYALADVALSWLSERRNQQAVAMCSCGHNEPSIDCHVHGMCAAHGHPCHCGLIDDARDTVTVVLPRADLG